MSKQTTQNGVSCCRLCYALNPLSCTRSTHQHSHTRTANSLSPASHTLVVVFADLAQHTFARLTLSQHSETRSCAAFHPLSITRSRHALLIVVYKHQPIVIEDDDHSLPRRHNDPLHALNHTLYAPTLFALLTFPSTHHRSVYGTIINP